MQFFRAFEFLQYQQDAPPGVAEGIAARPGARWAKALFVAGVALVALAVLMVVFPLVVAIIVAVLFFFGAAFCFRLAWICWRIGRGQGNHRIHVDVHPSDGPQD